MAKLADDLFESYRRYKGIIVDNPEYEPLSNGIDQKELRKLKVREYNRKYNENHKWELKCKRKDKIIEELRKQIEELQIARKDIGEFGGYKVSMLGDEEREELVSRINILEGEVESKNEKLEDMVQIVRILSKYI